jgi:nucleoside-diphosphate-sugar epimerase
MDARLNVVTGAFGYTGKYITQRLLAMGESVRTLTGHPDRPSPFGAQMTALPFNFDRPDELAQSLQGAATLYNTYWVRFSHGRTTFDQAVQNTQTLIRAAEQAGVRRIVHVSITNPSMDSPLPYFKGKAMLEDTITHSTLSYAIIRPTVIFGPQGILINNIAWLLKRFPVFAVLGSGDYGLQPIFVEDMADLAVSFGQSNENVIMDAVGPETFTFDELVRLVASKVDSRARIIHVNPTVAFLLASLIGYLVGDVVITREEVDGLMANLLISSNPPTGKTRLSDWLEQNVDTVGMRYLSEIGQHYRQ